MTAGEINTQCKEGKLLVMAVFMLRNDGPESVRGKTPDEILTVLDNIEREVEAS